MKKSIILICFLCICFSSWSAGASGNTLSIDSIVYNDDKSITVYGTADGEFSEYGIVIDEDVTSDSFNVSKKFKAYGKNADGRFAVRIADYNIVTDSAFNIRAYAVDSYEFYSDNELTADKVAYYSRIPYLSELSLNEGELYPQFRKDVFEYYALYDEIPSEKLKASYKVESSSDSAEYYEGTDIEIRLNSGFSESSYVIKPRLKKKLVLPAEKLIVKSKNSAAVSTDKAILSGDAIAYISFNTDELKEKFIPSSVGISGIDTGSLEVYSCTEPGLFTDDLSLLPLTYTPQYEDTALIKNNNILDETVFDTKTDFKLALRGTGDVVCKNIALEISFFENIPFTEGNGDISSADLSSVFVDGANEIYPPFDNNITEYYAVFEKTPSVLHIPTVVTENKNASYEISETDDGYIITVTSADKSAKKTYSVRIREYKKAELKLKYLTAKRTPYVLFDLSVPGKNTVPYMEYVGRVENKYGTNHSHLTAMAFDSSAVAESDIIISTAELNIFATSSIPEGINVNIYRSTNTEWTKSSAGKKFYAVANQFVPTGREGKLNKDTLIKYTGGRNSYTDYRYYNIPLKTVGFTDASSINLYYTAQWNEETTKTDDYQYALVWTGKNGAEAENGVGVLPYVEIKYFTK